MTTQESRLVIVIDAKKAQQQAKNLDNELSKLNTNGTATSNSINKLGKSADKTGVYFKNAGGKIVDINGKFISAQKAAQSLGVSVEDLNKHLTDFNKKVPQAKQGIDVFSKSIGGQSSNLSSFTQNLRQLTNQAGNFATAIAGAGVALTVFSASFASSVKEMTNLARLADSNTTEFQRMAVAASGYGVTQGQLADQIKDFNEKLGEFILTGKGEGVDAFEVLNKHAKMTTAEISNFALEMQKASGPQALLMYVEKLEEAGVSQEQMSFLVENMGNDLTKLLPILRNGGEELNRLANEAQRLGVILDEEAIEQALELEKQIKLMKMQAQGATNQFMSGFIPAVTQVASALNEAAGKSDLMKQAGADMGSVLKVVTSIAMGAYVAISSVARAVVGVAKDAAEAASSIGGIGGTGIKDWIGPRGAYNALTTAVFGAGVGAGGNRADALDTNAKAAESYAEFQDKLFKDMQATREKVNNELSQIGTGAGITAGLQTFAEDMGKEAKSAADKATNEAKRAADAAIREGNRAAEEIERIRQDVQYRYADREQQIEIDLQKELADIRKAGMGQGYEEAASKRAYLEKQIFLSQLQYEINEFKMSEQQKLKYRTEINQLIIKAATETTNETKAIQLQALDEQYTWELAKLDLARQQRLHAVREQFLTETEAMQERYRLERAEIILIKDDIERTATLQYNKMKERAELLDGMRKAQDEWEAKKPNSQRSNPYVQNDDQRREQLNASGEVYRAGMADIANREQDPNADFAALNAEKEALLQTHTQNMLAIEKAYEQARIDLHLSYGEQIVGSMSSIFKNMAGEQSTAYKAMFAIEKGFTIAQAALAMQRSISQAMALGFPANIPAIAAAVAQGAQIASVISSIKATGFANGGYTGNGGKHEVAGLVHKGEVVFSQKDVKNAGGVQAVENMRKYGTDANGISVNIENYGTNKDFEVQQISESEVRIIARDEAVKAVAKDLRNPNSLVSTSLKQSKNVVERR